MHQTTQLLRASPHRLHQIGVLDPEGIGVEILSLANRGHEDRQRHPGDQQVQVDFVVWDDLIGLAREVADVKGPFHSPRGTYSGNVDAKMREDAVHDSVGIPHGLQAWRAQVAIQRHERGKVFDIYGPPAVAHLVDGQTGEQHGQIDDACVAAAVCGMNCS